MGFSGVWHASWNQHTSNGEASVHNLHIIEYDGNVLGQCQFNAVVSGDDVSVYSFVLSKNCWNFETHDLKRRGPIQSINDFSTKQFSTFRYILME